MAINNVMGIFGSSGGRSSHGSGTPDPNRYHDPSAVRLEGESAAGQTILHKLPGNHGYKGWRGVVIPHATPLGGSRGHNPYAPSVIHIEPERIGNGGLVVDLAKVDPDRLAAIMKDPSVLNYEDPSDMAMATFAALAEPSSIPGGSSQAPANMDDDERLPPLQMPGTYVVPKASPGGGQVKRANFRSAPELRRRDEQMRTQSQERGSPPATAAVAQQIRSLHDTLDQESTNGSQPSRGSAVETQPIRVTLEIMGGHQFQVLYHDVVRQDMTLILVYDHNRPFQMVYFPPAMTDEEGEPVPMALLVHGRRGEKSILYKVQAPGIQFRYQDKEFCVLLVEKEKELSQDQER